MKNSIAILLSNALFPVAFVHPAAVFFPVFDLKRSVKNQGYPMH
jgi:hypothetical protein